jgi:two-component system, NtrC family, nitrogen regulation sensor histidine kinase NtrY
MPITRNIKRASLRTRIFIAMVTLTLVASILMAAVSLYQFKEEAKEYQEERLFRKESAIKEHFAYVLQNTTYPLTTENLPLIFKDNIYELADIHNMDIFIYDLKGTLLKSSKGLFKADTLAENISNNILLKIQLSPEKRHVEILKSNGIVMRNAYSEIKDHKFKPIGIIQLPYEEERGHYEREVNTFFKGLGQVYILMLLVSFAMAYVLSSYITQAIKKVAERITEIRFYKRNERIEVQSQSHEINLLINAYNSMIDELAESAAKLAKSEREYAWREMARQIAHEIKNPLTPMQLTIQSFQRRFDPYDPDIKIKLKDFTDTLLQQIETMSAVANAFSNFAQMPSQSNEELNVVEISRLALELFDEKCIHLESEISEIRALMDRTQLIRILTNLVKNALQALPEDHNNSRIDVRISTNQNNVVIAVKDNGSGIKDEDKEHIFEPKFTTKTSGMGLGLGIIKNIVENYGGSIEFTSEFGKGSEFFVILPILKS